MTTTNRYAPPKAVLEDRSGAETEMWREGKVLVLRKGGQFPHRCIKCNEPAVAPGRRQKLTWHPPAWYLLIFLAVLLYAIVALIVRKKAVVEVGLCERHQKRVLFGRIVGWGGFVVLLGLSFAAVAQPSGDLGLVAMLFALPWVLATITFNRLLIPHRIDDHFVRVKGCGPAFLRSLPDRTWG
jgi:hypothetical protein